MTKRKQHKIPFSLIPLVRFFSFLSTFGGRNATDIMLLHLLCCSHSAPIVYQANHYEYFCISVICDSVSATDCNAQQL